MKRITRILAVLVIPSLICLQANAWHPKKDYDGNKGGNRAPINGGIVLLVAAGAALGAKLLWDKNKRNKVASDASI
jgi:hypothetical protein